MKRLFVMLGLALALTSGALPCSAADSTNLDYDDPAMHFSPPPAWERLPVAPPTDLSRLILKAAYAKNAGKYNQKSILIEQEEYSGTLDGLESNVENDLRSQVAGTFIDKKTRVTLPNGMPAWWLKVSFGEQAGAFFRRYQYVLFDGRRGIVVSFVGRLADVEESEAREALNTLSVVLYPRGR